MEEKQIQIPDVNADAEERDNYTLIQETPEDDLPGENGIAIRYSKDFNIVQANELLRSKQSDLTLMESKLIRLAVSQIMKGDKDLRTYKVNVSQLAEFLEVPKTNVYRSMQDINISLMQRVIFIRDKEVPDKKGKLAQQRGVQGRHFDLPPQRRAEAVPHRPERNVHPLFL